MKDPFGNIYACSTKLCYGMWYAKGKNVTDAWIKLASKISLSEIIELTAKKK